MGKNAERRRRQAARKSGSTKTPSRKVLPPLRGSAGIVVLYADHRAAPDGRWDVTIWPELAGQRHETPLSQTVPDLRTAFDEVEQADEQLAEHTGQVCTIRMLDGDTTAFARLAVDEGLVQDLSELHFIPGQ